MMTGEEQKPMDRYAFNRKLKPELVRAVEEYMERDPDAATDARELLEFMAGTEDLFGRVSDGGHITCSAWLLDHTGSRAALVFHRRLGRWVQPGGHIEPMETPLQGALREAAEETGLDHLVVLDPALFHLEVFLFPEGKDGPAHRHYDLRYLIQAPSGSELTVPDEVDGAAWIPLDHLAEYSEEVTIRLMAAKTRLWLDGHEATENHSSSDLT